MTEKELSEILIRAEAATNGPWTSLIEGRDITSGSSFIMTGTEEDRGEDIEIIGPTEADQDFIAAAREDVPRLVREVFRLRKILEQNHINF